MIRLPLLRHDDPIWFPPPRRRNRAGREVIYCRVCGARFGKPGSAYLSAGATVDTKGRPEIDPKRHLAFLSIGFHGADPDCRDCVSAHVVEDLEGGQFDIEFCSLGCMRAWVNAVLDRLDRQLEIGRAKIARSGRKKAGRGPPKTASGSSKGRPAKTASARAVGG